MLSCALSHSVVGSCSSMHVVSKSLVRMLTTYCVLMNTSPVTENFNEMVLVVCSYFMRMLLVEFV